MCACDFRMMIVSGSGRGEQTNQSIYYDEGTDERENSGILTRCTYDLDLMNGAAIVAVVTCAVGRGHFFRVVAVAVAVFVL